MQELTLTEMQQVSGAGAAAGGTVGTATSIPLGGGIRVGSDGA